VQNHASRQRFSLQHALLAPLLAAVLAVSCREPLLAPLTESEVDAAGGKPGESERGAGGLVLANDGGAAGSTMDALQSNGGDSAREPAAVTEARPPTLYCADRSLPRTCRTHGDASKGVRLIGTLLEPERVRVGGVLDLDERGIIRCVDCDCGDDGGALVVECPDLVVSAGFINLHDHLSYAGTPPLPHPGERYQHRSDWRLGENGHTALQFSGGATSAQVLAQELRHALGGATSIVGAGGRRGLLRNLELADRTEGILPGSMDAETFPLDDASGVGDAAACEFGAHPDTRAVASSFSAYLPHLGEGTNQIARAELDCALGALDLLGPSSAVVHAMALSRAAARKLTERGSSVVWSPRSNLDLYGSTAPVALLSSLGVNIALGTDWLASGSMNLLRELACAKRYSSAVLGGYFDDYELWRMVTVNAAWALGLEGRLGALRPGLAGDLALFAGHGDAYASVVDARPSDVKLVLRQGTPLYGDSALVEAFGDDTCEELELCGQARRVCTRQSAVSLAEIRAAADAVYPLVSCDEPESEPRCDALVTHECPDGESVCAASPRPPAWDERDADGDGVPDVLDSCPRIADEQTDRDGDGRGDACDPCPVTNPGLEPCPLSIAALRRPGERLSPGTSVVISNAEVTALRVQGSKGYYIEDGDHAPYSGIFVYTKDTTPQVRVGERVTIQGYFTTFNGTDELVGVEVLSRSSEVEPYQPLVVELAALTDDSPRADALASLWLRVESAEVAVTNPDAPKDYDETGLSGGLRIDDLLAPELDNDFAVGTRFGSIQGIFGSSFGHHKLFPTSTSDLVVVEPATSTRP